MKQGIVMVKTGVDWRLEETQQMLTRAKTVLDIWAWTIIYKRKPIYSTESSNFIPTVHCLVAFSQINIFDNICSYFRFRFVQMPPYMPAACLR